jgi:signal transduction histidine kinase
MAAPLIQRKPTLLWPFVAIVGPMLLLAVMAGWTLRADRRSVEQEARNRAGELASTMLATAEKLLDAYENYTDSRPQSDLEVFIVNERFDLVHPPSWEWPPKPAPLASEDFSGLEPDKLGQWRGGEEAFAVQRWHEAVKHYLEFTDVRIAGPGTNSGKPYFTAQDSAPTDDTAEKSLSRLLADSGASVKVANVNNGRLAALALFRRAQALEALGFKARAIEAYDDVLVLFGHRSANAPRTESGVPLVPLAVIKVLELAGDRVSALPAGWRRNPHWAIGSLAATDASPLASEAQQRLRNIGPALADSANIEPDMNLFESWERAERARKCYAAATAAQSGATGGWADFFWVGLGDNRWLAVRQVMPKSIRLAPSDRGYATLPLTTSLTRLSLPFIAEPNSSQFVTIVEMAGCPLVLSKGRAEADALGGGDMAQKAVEGAATVELRSERWPVRVSVGLIDPDHYFASVQRRQVILGSLVALAVAGGFLAAWILRRSMLKQLSLNEQKSNFVSSVSHELRAPIASVRLMAESLERGNVTEPAKQREYFHFIGQECRRLSALIANVLDFARIEQGRKQYEFEPTDLRKLVEATVQLMEPYAEEKGISLKSEIRNPKSEIEVDGHAIQQALVNLIDNAIKHSAAGQAVTVSLEARSAERGTRNAGSAPINHQLSTINLSVSDSGPGIPPAEHEKIFERFYRLGSELRRETQGIGIGLSIVRHIVEAHGGRVLVESKVGQGSRFTIELPVDKPETRNSKSE